MANSMFDKNWVERIFEGSPHQGLPNATWRKLYEGKPMAKKTPKPKKLTLKQMLDAANEVNYKLRSQILSQDNELGRRGRQIERLSTDIAWYKDTVRQMIAAMKRS